jgi:hypothetical protein
MKKIQLKKLEEIAQQATKVELEKYVIPDEIRGGLVLTTIFEGDDRIFVLYVPSEHRSDADVIARTRVNAVSGNVSVEISNLEKRQ